MRTARPGEKLTTLDGKERALDAEDLLICDATSPLVLAGVMGGASSEVTAKTTRVLLECATFQPTTVRRSSKRHALQDRVVPPLRARNGRLGRAPRARPRRGADRRARRGHVLAGRVDVHPTSKGRDGGDPARRRRWRRCSGYEVPAAECEQILTALGFT